jgi:bis(5'-nucleosyl)-tetraphosphatase (symmetrical)
MAVYAIGDLQGCYDELRRLLDKVRFDETQDQLWLTGDLVNRGPQSLDVLRFVAALGPVATVVLGNHDLHLLALAYQPHLKHKRDDTLQAVLAAPDREELLAWLLKRPLLHTDAALKTTMVHAGVPPQWDLAMSTRCARDVEMALINSPLEFFAQMYGDTPDLWTPELAEQERLRFSVNCLTRLRACNSEGKLLLKFKGPATHMPAGAFPWFRAPNRRTSGQRIVFGHWSALGYHNADNVVALDTGCVWGGHLTALRLDQEMSPVQVSCEGYRRLGPSETADQE